MELNKKITELRNLIKFDSEGRVVSAFARVPWSTVDVDITSEVQRIQSNPVSEEDLMLAEALAELWLDATGRYL